MLFNLLLLLLVILHDFHPLSLHQAAFLNVELFLRLSTHGYDNKAQSLLTAAQPQD